MDTLPDEIKERILNMVYDEAAEERDITNILRENERLLSKIEVTQERRRINQQQYEAEVGFALGVLGAGLHPYTVQQDTMFKNRIDRYSNRLNNNMTDYIATRSKLNHINYVKRTLGLK